MIDKSIELLLLEYDDIISPSNLLKNQQDFNKFLNEPATEEDLKAFLKVCEEQELYEWCIDIKQKINSL